MHDDNTKKKKLQHFLFIKRSFYSYCRNAEGTTFDDSDYCNELIEQLKVLYSNMDIYNYINLLDRLKKITYNNQISKNDALIVLVHVVDPSYKMYTLFDDNNNYDQFKKEVINEFKFYDNDFFNIEKNYIEKNNLNKKYGWKYKNEA